MRVTLTLATAILCFASHIVFSAPLTAPLLGSLTGTVQNDEGQLLSPQGAIYGTVYANDEGGVVSATIEGQAATTGALGMAIQFTAQYNANTLAFAGLYSDTPGETPNSVIVFNNVGGLTWKAAIAGMAPSASGERAYNLELELEIQQNAIFAQAELPPEIVFSGTFDRNQLVQLPVNLPALQTNQSINLDMRFQGDWSATAVPTANGGSTFTGKASGTFSTLQVSSLTITPPGGAITVPVSISGSFGGALFPISATELAFQGAWVSHNSEQTLGGNISIQIPLNDISNFPFHLSGTARISTGAPQQPSLDLPFSADSSFPLALKETPTNGSSQDQEPDEPVVASSVKIKHLGINIDAYDPATNRAGDFQFTKEKMSFDLLFFNFGFVVPANSAGPEKVNPQPTFILPLGTKVHALIDGEVVNVTKLYSDDYSVMMRGEGSDLIFELEHVINVKVKPGDKVQAGDIVAEVSDYDAHNYAGLGLVEIGILKGGATAQHLCPFDYLDESIKASTLQKITALQAAWETYLGNSSIYDESQVVIPGCYRRTPVDG